MQSFSDRLGQFGDVVETGPYDLLDHENNRKYRLNAKKIHDFWSIYCRQVSEGSILNISENPGESMPVFIEVLKQQEEDISEMILMRIVAKVINNKAVLKGHELTCFLLKSKTWETEGIDGNITFEKLGFIFPFARSNPENLKLLFQEVKKELVKNDIEIDEDNIRMTSRLYGSSDPEENVLKLVSIFDHAGREVIEDLTWLRNHASFDVIHSDESEEFQFYLPLLFSNSYHHKNLEFKNLNVPKPKAQVQVKIFGTQKRRIDVPENKEQILEKLLSIIDDKRYLLENFWMEIGQVFASTYKFSEKGLELWKEYTLAAVKNNFPEFMITEENNFDKTITSLYYTFSEKRFTVKTISHYAHEDSPASYLDFHKKWFIESMEGALSCNDYDIAVAVYRISWLLFIYCPKNCTWYGFVDGKWAELNKEALTLRNFISTTVVKYFEDQLNSVRQRAVKDPSITKDFLDDLTSSVNKVITYLRSNSSKNKLLNECKELFKNENFSSLIDTAPYLTGVKNGILEIVKNKVIFRKAKPEDYIIKSCKVSYNSKLTWEDIYVKQCMKWFKQIFHHEDLLEQFLMLACTSFEARNSQKIFPIFSGEKGHNCKSTLVKLFEETFGDYVEKINSSVLTENNNNSTSATPELAQAEGTRWVFVDEPDRQTPMKCSTIKKLTGGDKLKTRKLFSNGGCITATWTLVLVTNYIPGINNPDLAVQNRLLVYSFESVWSTEAPESEEEQQKKRIFKRNNNFESTLNKLAPAFLWIAVQLFPEYAKNGIKRIDRIADRTNEYWKTADYLSQFLEHKVRDSPDHSIHLDNFVSNYRLWFKTNCPNAKISDRATIKIELSTHWGKPENDTWKGKYLIEMFDMEYNNNPVIKNHKSDEKKDKVTLNI